jgi:O-Antigen ligase
VSRSSPPIPRPSPPTVSPSPPTVRSSEPVIAIGVAGAIVALASLTSSSVDPSVPIAGGASWSEIACLVLGAGACAAIALVGGRGPRFGLGSVGLLAAFTALAALSILWSVEPDWSWFGTDQLLAYLGLFAGATAAARLCPGRWRELICGLALAATALGAWALLAKVFPATLAADNTYGRLQAPFGYWNAVGATAALGLPLCMWSAAARELPRAVRAASVPAISVLVATVALSLSRSSLAAAVIGGALLIALAPGRLRTLAGLAVGVAGALPIVLWALGHTALSADNAPAAAQDAAGHTFGLVLVAVLVATAGAGWAYALASERVRLDERVRRLVGTALVALVALVPVAGIGALAASSRGLTGEISHAWQSLTTTRPSGVGNNEGRITQLGSSRPLYWHEGLDVGNGALLGGVGELGYGIARLKYTHDAAKSDHAHSYLVQTFADLGLAGLALTLSLLAAWAAAVRRTLGGWWPGGGEASRGAGVAATGERGGMVALLAGVLAFGIQSALDWTSSFPGVAAPALLAAGWLAGRGPLGSAVGIRPPEQRRRLRERPATGALLTLIAALTLAGAWLMWQPLRSAQELAASENATTAAAAFAHARAAAAADPLSYQPLLRLSALYAHARQPARARLELVKATRLAPEAPQPWAALGDFDIARGRKHDAVIDMSRVLELDKSPDPYTEDATAVIARAFA